MKADKENKFQELIQDHTSQIQRICFGFTNSSEEVKDLYQEVLINVWKSIDGFRNDAAIATWLHRITINTCLLWNKRKKKFLSSKSMVEYMNLEVEELEKESSPELIQLRRAINQLKPGDKTLILLVLEELSYNEIAEVTGLSI